MIQNISIIIPTYNERENIAQLIPDIQNITNENKMNAEIIIVDDNSPDKTSEIAEKLNKQYGNIKVIKRSSKQGVGSARRLGFSHASMPIIISMEGDNSHKPKYIPELVKEINKGADIVIGSRYMKGSKIINWPIKRRIISMLANWIARFFAGVKLTDVTNGYRAFKKEILEKLVIDSESYPYNMEFACETIWKGYKASELPIIFEHRKIGTSKLYASREFISFFATAFRFSYTYRPMRVFGLIGALFFFIGFLSACYLIYLKINTGFIGDRLPLIVTSLILIISGIQIFFFGLIVNIINKLRRDISK